MTLYQIVALGVLGLTVCGIAVGLWRLCVAYIDGPEDKIPPGWENFP